MAIRLRWKQGREGQGIELERRTQHEGDHVPAVRGQVLPAGAPPPLPRLWQGLLRRVLRQQGPGQVQTVRGCQGVQQMLPGALKK